MKYPSRRLFVLCDGTGKDAVYDGLKYTNVVRFQRCLKNPGGDDGIQQLVWPHKGVGTTDGSKHLVDSVTGQKIHGVIQEAYHWICGIYRPGDELHLIGFSRGAFAVRSLACFINDFGILRAERLSEAPMVYKLWEQSSTTKLSFFIDRWERDGHLLRNIPIETCASWDTVRSMHFPKGTLQFVENRVPVSLKHAFQALALNEKRIVFPPVLWNTTNRHHTNIRQTWFIGDHTDIGGGRHDSGLSMISLLWMIAQFKEYTAVAFDEEKILYFMTPSYRYEAKMQYYRTDHVHTPGNVHGGKSYQYYWNDMARKQFLKPADIELTKPPLPINRAGILDKEWRFTRFEGKHTPQPPAISPNDGQVVTQPDSTCTGAWTTIHHTVRLLIFRRLVECFLLEGWTTYMDSNALVSWSQDDHTRRGFWEDRTTDWEYEMHHQWIKREDKFFGSDAGQDVRFTAFLSRYRNELLALAKLRRAKLQRVSSLEQLHRRFESTEQDDPILQQGKLTVARIAPRRHDSFMTETGVEIVSHKKEVHKYVATSNASSRNASIAYPIPTYPPEIIGDPPKQRNKQDIRRLWEKGLEDWLAPQIVAKRRGVVDSAERAIQVISRDDTEANAMRKTLRDARLERAKSSRTMRDANGSSH